MTSVTSGYEQVPANKLYVNIGSVYFSSIYTSSMTTPTWLTGTASGTAITGVYTSTLSSILNTAGSAIFRDLGKTLYVPSPNPTPVGAVPGISTVLRKVQLVPAGTLGTYGVGGPASGLETDYFTGYIQLGGLQQGGGGNGMLSKFVRLN
jgi:hypothetical protein